MELYIFILIVVVVIIILPVAYFQEKKRREALQLVADQLGLTYSTDADEGAMLLKHLESSLDLFSQGRSKRVRNLLRGESQQAKIDIFDYEFRTGLSKNSSTVTQTVIRFWLVPHSMPTFSLQPKQIWQQVGAGLGSLLFGHRNQDIDFDTHPTFSSTYMLRGKNKPAVRSLFTEPVLDFYEQIHELCTEGSDRTLIIYRPGKRLRPEEIASFLDEAHKVLNLFQPPR